MNEELIIPTKSADFHPIVLCNETGQGIRYWTDKTTSGLSLLEDGQSVPLMERENESRRNYREVCFLSFSSAPR